MLHIYRLKLEFVSHNKLSHKEKVVKTVGWQLRTEVQYHHIFTSFRPVRVVLLFRSREAGEKK
jgi:hypothetical protein